MSLALRDRTTLVSQWSSHHPMSLLNSLSTSGPVLSSLTPSLPSTRRWILYLWQNLLGFWTRWQVHSTNLISVSHSVHASFLLSAFAQSMAQARARLEVSRRRFT